MANQKKCNGWRAKQSFYQTEMENGHSGFIFCQNDVDVLIELHETIEKAALEKLAVFENIEI